MMFGPWASSLATGEAVGLRPCVRPPATDGGSHLGPAISPSNGQPRCPNSPEAPDRQPFRGQPWRKVTDVRFPLSRAPKPPTKAGNCANKNGQIRADCQVSE